MRYCSVTSTLSVYCDFSAIPPAVLEAAALRGSAVHEVCAGYAKGLFVPALPGDQQGFYDSFRGWFDAYIDQPLFVEERMDDPGYRYTGIVDLVAVMIDGRAVVIDYKTPATMSAWWAGQLAAYRHLVNLRLPDLDLSCFSLMLKRDGKPAKAIQYQYSDRDFAAFLSALNAFRYFGR